MFAVERFAQDQGNESAVLRLDRSSTMKKVFSVGGVIHCVACLECGAITRLRVDPKELAAALT